MLTKDKVVSMLYDAINDCITIGKAYMRIDSYSSLPRDRNLKELYSWTEVVTLSKVLEMDDCVVWNDIIRECPNLGEFTVCQET